MQVGALILGLLLIVLVLVDLGWTTVAAGSGAGPLTRRVAQTIWRLALIVHGRRATHAALSLAGVIIVFAVLVMWIALLVAGWSLVFSGFDGAVLDSASRSSADLGDRLYFVGYTVFTLGNGDFMPGSGIWQFATVAATSTGLMMVTLSITYLVPVASAVGHRRSLATHISTLGQSPSDILDLGWNGSDFDSLSDHLVELTTQFGTARQQHLMYPVVHYFHSGDVQNSAPPNIAHLSQALQLLAHGTAPSARPPRAVYRPLERAIDAFLLTVRDAGLPSAEPLPPASLEVLRGLGVPVVGESDYLEAVESTHLRRSLLAALLFDDGWSADELDAVPSLSRRE